jgi:hypothetical protein
LPVGLCYIERRLRSVPVPPLKPHPEARRTLRESAMPTPLLETTVWPDWQTIETRQANENARLWRFAQLSIAATTLLALVIGPSGTSWIWRGMLQGLVLPLVLWLPPLWYLYKAEIDRRHNYRPLLTPCLVLLGITLAAYLVESALVRGWVGSRSLPLLLPLGVAAPAATWWLFRRLRRDFPGEMLRLGVTGKKWLPDILAGAAAGCALGLHLLLMWSLMPGKAAVIWPSPAVLALTICSLLGPLLLGEEMLFRGLGVRILSGAEQQDPVQTTYRIGLLNLYVYLIPVVWPSNPQVWIWRLVYGGLLALIATALRFRLGNLIPSLACNIVFSLFMAVVLGS